MHAKGIEVNELEPVECVEITGSYRIVSMDLMRVEEIELPSTLEPVDEQA